METVSQTILVTGATGNQGGAVLRHLMTRSLFTVRAMVRSINAPRAQVLKQAGAELVEGDLNDRASLDRALEGASGVFSVQSMQEDLRVEVRQGETLADAAKAADVSHFVYSSVGSAERKTGIPHFDSKFQIEEHVRAIGIPHTILRPVAFFFNYNAMRPVIEQGMLPQPLSPGTKLMQLSEEDYGRIVADVFDHPADFLGRAIEVASADMTMTEMAAAFSEVVGKPVAYRQISFDEFEQQAGKETTIMYHWFEDAGYDTDLAALTQEFGEPQTFAAYLREHGWADPAGESK